jgi:hypothetical protein
LKQKPYRLIFTMLVCALFLVACAANVQPEVSTEASTAVQNEPTYEDQLRFEQTIRDFASAIEKKDFKSAEGYCTQDFIDYIENVAYGSGVFADSFGLAINKGYDLRLVEVKGYYFNDTGQPDYNISKDKPTLSFDVTFEFVDSDDKKWEAGGYTTGVKRDDGTYLIGGFASGL